MKIRTWWSSIGWPPRVTWHASSGGAMGSGPSEYLAIENLKHEQERMKKFAAAVKRNPKLIAELGRVLTKIGKRNRKRGPRT